MHKLLTVSNLDDVTQIGFASGAVLDLTTIQQIGRELCDLLENKGRKKIVVDMGQVRFMSSQALGMLLTLRRKAGQLDARIIFANPRDEIHKLFEVTKLDQMFELVSSPADALQLMKTPKPPAG